MRRALLSTAVAAALLAAVPAASPAAIVYERSIAGVRLDMSKTQVRRVLGAPARIVSDRNTFGSYTEYRYSGLVVSFQGGSRVTSVSTTRRSQRTRDGLGVGSTQARLRRVLRGETCFSGDCRTKSRVGYPTTAFIIRRGVVARVTVGYILD